MKKLLIAAFFLCGCSEKFVAHRIHNVQKVYAHGVGSYSATSIGEGNRVTHQFVTSPSRYAEIFMDVKPDEKMWVEVQKECAIIHVRSVEDIVVVR